MQLTCFRMTMRSIADALNASDIMEQLSFHLDTSAAFDSRNCKRLAKTLELKNILANSSLHKMEVFQYLKKAISGSREFKLKLISGVHVSDPGNIGDQVFKIEHCALQERGNQWNLEVKYRQRGCKASKTRWIDVWDFYPDATVKVKHNYIELAIDSPKEDHEFALFGIPEINDKKRMQIGIFGEKPMQGKMWKVFVTLFDDTVMAFKHLCDKEESKGRRLLTSLAALFVSNSDEDIKIDMSALDKGWQVKGSKVKTIKSKDAWNSPENSTDFPSCVFEISHVDETKLLFFCGITASHSNDAANTEVVAFFEQKKGVLLTDQELMVPQELALHEDKTTVVFIFLQMLVFLVGCFTGAGFDPFSQRAGSAAAQLEC